MDNAVNPLVEMIGISKSYGGVRACRDIDLTVLAGGVHALLGENGAGKPTLMESLSGDVTGQRWHHTGNAGRRSGDGRSVVHGRGGTGQQGRPVAAAGGPERGVPARGRAGERQAVGEWLQPRGNTHSRWLEDSFELPATTTEGKTKVTVTIRPAEDGPAWSAATYRALSHG